MPVNSPTSGYCLISKYPLGNIKSIVGVTAVQTVGGGPGAEPGRADRI